MPQLSEAALHFGQAMCPPGDTNCVNRVGSAWEQDIEAKFGALSSTPPVVTQHQLIGSNGQQLGRLTMIDRQVMLCFTKPGQDLCAPIGVGNEALETARAMLGLQGITVR